jgi:hypothetical protein
MKIPDAIRTQHDAIMSVKPISYRGFTLKPLSHINQPHWIEGKFVYWGWNVCDASGFVNMGPGCTWGRTIEQAMEIADCILEAGTHPTAYEELDSWNRRFWTLMRNPSLRAV